MGWGGGSNSVYEVGIYWEIEVGAYTSHRNIFEDIIGDICGGDGMAGEGGAMSTSTMTTLQEILGATSESTS